MFERTRLRLTAWYLLIIMTISLLFSAVIYARVNSDLVHFEQMQLRLRSDIESGIIRPMGGGRPFVLRLDPEEIHEARSRLVFLLGFVNLSILLISGGAGYFLAGRTLRPIKIMLDEQHRFISDSSHELRTPLTSLRSEIEVALRNKDLSVKDARKILESNLEEVESLQTLSDNLLELSQNGSFVNKKLFEKVLVSDIALISIKKVDPLAKAKQITIKDKTISLRMLGAKERLVELFIILIDNSIKYSPKKSKIIVSSKKSDGKIIIEILDHGKGIEEKDIPHIFDRFYRADESRSEAGYGLGLSIAKKIVDSHNGSISVKSKPGKTTSFILTFPEA